MTKNITKNLNLIGNTPLIRIDLNLPKTKILAKLETYNLTGSIKDRMALHMMQKAQQRGKLKKGTTIIEATTGNTGISFAALSSILGYKMIAVMPENMSQERIKILELFGAKIVLTPKEKGPMGAIEKRNKLSRSIANSWAPDQFSNSDNIKAHKKGIAKEILAQFSGKIDYLVHGIGTGGTLMAIGKVLKQKLPKITVVAVEPKESPVLSGGEAGNHNIQGIGEGFIPSLVDRRLIDRVIKVSTHEAIKETKMLAKKQGLLVGFSSGANIAAIKKIVKKDNQPKTILTIFADRGERYLSVL